VPGRPGLKSATQVGGNVVFEAGSGSYRFQVTGSAPQKKQAQASQVLYSTYLPPYQH
jgi:hypothetical protein